MNDFAIANKLANLADAPKEISLREFMTKIYIRQKLFWACVIIPVLLALIITALVPTTWNASVQIMLRYSSSESSFLQGLIPADRSPLSGASSAELLRSMPTLVNTIRENGIQDEDIYKKWYEVVGGHVSGLLEDYFPSELPPGLPGVDPKTMLLAKSFKDSLEEKSVGSSKKKPVEVLERSSQLPPSMKGDELITVHVRSFNRAKVAQMTNGLAKAFIDEYYRVSAEEAHRSTVFLDQLVKQASNDLRKIQRGDFSGDMLRIPDIAPAQGATQPSPLVDSMSRELTTMESKLAEANEVYNKDWDSLAQLRGQIATMRGQLSKQERIDMAREMVEQLKLRRYRAENTEKLYTNRLVPISIVEPAFTPKKSFSKVAVRYVIAGGVGLVLGIMLGLGLVVVLDVTDPRIHTTWQARNRIGLPVLAALPVVGKRDAGDPLRSAADTSPGMVNGLLQIFCRLEGRGEGLEETQGSGRSGKIITIASPNRGEGKTFVALALAGALGQGRRHKVLLVDANLQDAGLSQLLGQGGAQGYADCMLDGKPCAERILANRYRSCDLLPAGQIEKSGELGLYGSVLGSQFASLRQMYDYVIVDTGPLLASNEALVSGMHADHFLMVLEAGQTRRATVMAVLQSLREVKVVPDGLIFNRKRDVLPGFLYRNV